MNNNILTLLINGADGLKIPLEEKAVFGLLKFAEILSDWNTKVNLVSYKTHSDLITLHILDCLILLKMIDPSSEAKIMDIGSGAGFPGMVLKIAANSFQLTLVEKNPKKVLFLKETIRLLGLVGITVLNRDYNALKNPDHSRKYDILVSRAFSSKPAFFKNLTFFVKTEGAFIIMAGPSFNSNLAQIEGFMITDHWEGKLPYSDYSRKILKYSRMI